MKFSFINTILGLLLIINTSLAQSLIDVPFEYFGGGLVNNFYLDWVSDRGNSYYDRSVFLSSLTKPDEGVAVHWRISNNNNDDEGIIYLAIATKAIGWVGFGLSENGGMHGSDIIYLHAKQPNILYDGHVLQDKQPLIDDCQNWNLTNTIIGNGYIIFEANRLLNTNDNQDRVIEPYALASDIGSPIIAAWGDSPVMTYHGPDNRARGQIRWFSTIESDQISSFQEAIAERAEGSFLHLAQNYKISTNDTEYVAFCLSRDDLIAQGVPMNATTLYLVGYEPLIDTGAQAHVHHFVVTSSAEDEFDPCIVAAFKGVGAIAEGGIGQIYTWAPGEYPRLFPDNVALPFGDYASAKSIRMVIHYDNPLGIENIMDNSGVRYYYTTKPVEKEVGIMVLGDPLVTLRDEPVGGGLTSHKFDCPSSCSAFVLDEPVTVFREYLHMHKTGIGGRNEVIRDGEIVHTARVDYFDFEQRGMHGIQEENFILYPNDAFRLTCEYNSTNRHVFGLASDEEMCMQSVFYYPKKTVFGRFPWACTNANPLPACDTLYETRTLENEQFLGREFGNGISSDGMCLSETFEGSANDNEGSDDVEISFSNTPQSANFVTIYIVALVAVGWMI